MNTEFWSCVNLNDADLLLEVHRLTKCERAATAQLVAALGEVDARRLYLSAGCSSLFSYCTQVLHLSEHAAYARIEAARVARKWPVVLELLTDGSLHLTALGLLSRHLTSENHESLLAAARHKSKRDVELIVAGLRPLPDVSSGIRKLSTPSPTLTADAVVTGSRVDDRFLSLGSPGAHGDSRPTVRRVEITPLAPQRYKVQFTMSCETNQKLLEARELIRHQIPSGDVAEIFDRALTLLLQALHRTRHAAVKRPRTSRSQNSHSRYVPAAVKREVWRRDAGRCAFVGTAGRCSERGFLEYHHVVAFADGGRATADNLQLRCRAHNAHEAERWFGAGEGSLIREAHHAYESERRVVGQPVRACKKTVDSAVSNAAGGERVVTNVGASLLVESGGYSDIP